MEKITKQKQEYIKQLMEAEQRVLMLRGAIQALENLEKEEETEVE